MKRRWIIRSLFIGLLLLCIGGWVASYWVDDCGLSYDGDKFGLAGFLIGGKIHLMTCTGSFDNPLEPDSWLGFGLRHGPPSTYSWGVIPFWFPTTISAALLWLVWRKTRPKPVGRAFPVEVKQSHAKEEKTP